MENNQADPANPILNTKGPCFVTLNEERVDSLFNKRAVPDLLNKCPKFPPWNLIFLRGCCVLEGISAPQVHTLDWGGTQFLFPGRKFPGHSLLFLFFEKKGIVLGHPKEDPIGG